MTEFTDKQIREWILSDESLYHRAREFSGGGDDEMYEKLYEFIDQHRDELVRYIQERLATGR